MLKYRKKKHRVARINFWIEVARYCVEIGNFNSMMGIISGLSLTPVARLKKTVSRKLFHLARHHTYGLKLCFDTRCMHFSGISCLLDE